MEQTTEQQGITPEIAEYPEAGPFWVGLWAVARHWVAILADVFEPDVIATTGITRAFALRCRNWLWPIEGLIRRLIIAAAMKLDPAPKPATPSRKPAKPGPHTPSVAFAVLPRLPGRRGASMPPRPTKPQPEHRHLAFPGDALLSLFPHHPRRNAPPASCRSLNPLNRRGRRSRWDPDYQSDPIKEQESYNRHFFGPFRQHLERWERPPPRERAHTDRSSPYWKPPGGYPPEWKRLEQEWARVIPSLSLAGRIRALARVLEHPQRWIERTARKLTANLIAKIRAAPLPHLKKPKLDRTASGFLHDPLLQSHALFDTS